MPSQPGRSSRAGRVSGDAGGGDRRRHPSGRHQLRYLREPVVVCTCQSRLLSLNLVLPDKFASERGCNIFDKVKTLLCVHSYAHACLPPNDTIYHRSGMHGGLSSPCKPVPLTVYACAYGAGSAHLRGAAGRIWSNRRVQLLLGLGHGAPGWGCCRGCRSCCQTRRRMTRPRQHA